MNHEILIGEKVPGSEFMAYEKISDGAKNQGPQQVTAVG